MQNINTIEYGGKEAYRSVVPKSQLVTIHECVQRCDERDPYERVESVDYGCGTSEAVEGRSDCSFDKAPWNQVRCNQCHREWLSCNDAFLVTSK